MQTLSDHFTLEEFLFSETAARAGKPVSLDMADVDLGLTGAVLNSRLYRLVTEIMEPLRVELGVPLTVTSGFRPLWLNRQIGSGDNSQHCLGLACDFKSARVSPFDLACKVVEMGLPFDQLILEFDRWVHVSIPEKIGQGRGQKLTASKGSKHTVYHAGLHTQEEL